jgi:hypothetical protein
MAFKIPVLTCPQGILAWCLASSGWVSPGDTPAPSGVTRWPGDRQCKPRDPFPRSVLAEMPVMSSFVSLNDAGRQWQSCSAPGKAMARSASGLYLPVANNFISAMACGALNDAGLVRRRLSLEPVILQRLRSAGELPQLHWVFRRPRWWL